MNRKLTDYELRFKAQIMVLNGINLQIAEGQNPYLDFNIDNKLQQYIDESHRIVHKFVTGEINFTEWQNELEEFLELADTKIDTAILNSNFKSVKMDVDKFNVMCESASKMGLSLRK